MAKKTNCLVRGVPKYRINPVIDTVDGNSVRKNFYGSCKAEAEDKFKLFLVDYKKRKTLDGSTTVGALMHEWIYNVERVNIGTKGSSFDRYEGIYRNYLKDSPVAKKKLVDIVSMDVQKYYNRLYDCNKTSSQIRNAHKVFRKFFRYCVDQDYLIKSPCSGVVIPGDKGNLDDDDDEITIFTETEILLIYKEITDNRLRFLVKLALGTGLRLGELLALTYADIKDGTVIVNKTLSEYSEIGADAKRTKVIRDQAPKSKKGVRKVPLPAVLNKELTRHHLTQKKEQLKSLVWEKSDYMFTTNTGKRLSESNIRKSWKLILSNCGIPYKKFHSLRHSYISNLVNSGVPLTWVQELAGHSRIEMTAKYAHTTLGDKRLAIDKIINRR